MTALVSQPPKGGVTQYRVQQLSADGRKWRNIDRNMPGRRVERREGGYEWNLSSTFPRAEKAIEAIMDRRTYSPSWSCFEHRVIVEGSIPEVIWTSDKREQYVVAVTVEVPLDCPSTAGGTVSDIEQPLLIPRTVLIETLDKRLKEEQQKRADADAAVKAARQGLLDTVGKLTTDQVTNILTHHVAGSPDSLQKLVTEWIDEEKFISKELTPTSTETSIEKLARILGLATNDEIEVKPGDPVYPLL